MLESSTVQFSRTSRDITTQGKVRFRGGLELRSSDSDFGGLSALVVSDDGTSFVAVTDQAHWVTGTLSYEGGNLVAAAGGRIAPMLDLDGVALHDKAGDAEGLAAGADHSVAGEAGLDLFVSFEGKHRVWRYPFGSKGVEAVPVDVPIPEEARRAPKNAGLEGLTGIGEGLLFAVSERYLDARGNYRAYSLPFALHAATPGVAASIAGTAPVAALPEQKLSIRPRPPFSMTDVRQLPGGDLLTLERRYNPIYGVGIEMRRIALAELKNAVEHGVPLDGEIVASFDPSFEIDNMEGLSVRRGDAGETLVYCISDDNFNRTIQRTLLLMYELRP